MEKIITSTQIFPAPGTWTTTFILIDAEQVRKKIFFSLQYFKAFNILISIIHTVMDLLTLLLL